MGSILSSSKGLSQCERIWGRGKPVARKDTDSGIGDRVYILQKKRNKAS